VFVLFPFPVRRADRFETVPIIVIHVSHRYSLILLRDLTLHRALALCAAGTCTHTHSCTHTRPYLCGGSGLPKPDFLDTVRKTQRVLRLRDAVGPWVEAENHEGLTVASERVAQKVGELRVAIRHMPGLEFVAFLLFILLRGKR
jgi:hypothetical protein